jgi:hypothetical protein
VLGGPQARVAQEGGGGVPAQQDRVLVEHAVGHDAAGHRVERVVLEDRRDAAGPQHARHLGRERAPARRRHVVHDADREDDVDRAVLDRQRRAVVMAELGLGDLDGRAVEHALDDVDADDLAEAPDEVPVGRADPAADVDRGQARRVADAAAREVDQRPGLELREVVGVLAAERDDLLDLVAVAVLPDVEVGGCRWLVLGQIRKLQMRWAM